jgi:hypothetical protein
LALVIIGAYHVHDLPGWLLSAALIAPFVLVAAGLIVGAWRRASLGQTARWVDGRQHLQERLSTALEFATEEQSGPWRDLVVTDAAEHAKSLDARSLIAFSLPRAARWAVLVLAITVGLGFVPEYRSKQFKQAQADKENIKEVAKQLADLTRQSLEKRAPTLTNTVATMEAITNLAEQLARQPTTRSEALKDLVNMSEKLKDQLKEMGDRDPALKRLQQAARASSGNDSQSSGGLQKQIEAMQKQLGTPTANPEALDKMKKDLQKLQEAAKGMADKNSPGSEAERQKMSEAMSALSKQIQEMGMQLPQLDAAIDAMKANQTDLVLKDLQEATTDLEKMRDMAKSMQQLQQQMEKMGKDLAEQLKNGQPEAAQQTLEKMAQQLKNSNLSNEQKQQIMNDVASAVQPAGNYGEVADKLKQAGKQMQSGDKQGASQSLSEAAKELAKLSDQMGDAQQMMAELENLNKASQCVGSGQRWGMCQNGSGYNPNGQNKPGGGVGTWADENSGWTYNGQWSSHWDNSGVNRPDQAGKGQTDRGEGELSDALKPDKVKGQFSPGGQMPSITLKGVSIKGASKVEYEAAAAAAQSDAQSALSQEKVPRAYQGAVKDYFDDLKK